MSLQSHAVRRGKTSSFLALLLCLAWAGPAARAQEQEKKASASASGKASLSDIETSTSADTAADEKKSSDDKKQDDKKQDDKQDDKKDDKTDEAAAAEAAEALPWDLLHRRYNTWGGPTGGLFIVDPSNGEVGSVRLQLGFDTYSGNGFLLAKDHVEQDGQTLSFSWTAGKIFEVYAALGNRGTSTSKDPLVSLTAKGGPNSLSSQGDATLGGKVGGKIAPLVYFGGDLRATLANQVGGGGIELDATSVGLRSALSINLQELAKPVPFVARFNLGYLFDNSAKLVGGTEDNAYARLNTAAAPRADETRHLVNRFERYAMGTNRLDRFSIGVGFEVPVQAAERFYLSPIAEWRLDIPVNRQGYDCPNIKSGTAWGSVGSVGSVQDGCYERTPGSALPMNLALGVRAIPPIRGVSATLAVDIGLTGTSTFVRELAPSAPYRVMIALAYDYDARPPEKVIVEVEKKVQAPPAPAGRIQGTVVSSEGLPVAGAVVAFADHDVSAMATSSDGHFVSEEFGPGEVVLAISHPDYDDAQCGALIPEAGGNVEAHCTLNAKPRVGKLNGRVIDAFGSPVISARLQLTGPTTSSATSDVRGTFEVENLPAGEYTLRTQADGHFVRLSKVSVQARTTTTTDVTLMQKPATASVSVRGTSISAKAIKFVGNSTDLDAAGAQAVAELADLLLTQTQINIRIQGYGDDAVALSRALLVKQRLVDAGVPEGRIDALGGGTGRLVITIAN